MERVGKQGKQKGRPGERYMYPIVTNIQQDSPLNASVKRKENGKKRKNKWNRKVGKEERKVGK